MSCIMKRCPEAVDCWILFFEEFLSLDVLLLWLLLLSFLRLLLMPLRLLLMPAVAAAVTAAVDVAGGAKEGNALHCKRELLSKK